MTIKFLKRHQGIAFLLAWLWFALVGCPDRLQGPSANAACDLARAPTILSDPRWQEKSGKRYVVGCLRVVWEKADHVESQLVVLRDDGTVLNADALTQEPPQEGPLTLDFATQGRFGGEVPLFEFLIFSDQANTQAHRSLCEGAMRQRQYRCLDAPTAECWFGWRLRLSGDQRQCSFLVRKDEIPLQPPEVSADRESQPDASSDRGPENNQKDQTPETPACESNCQAPAIRCQDRLIQRCDADPWGCQRWSTPKACPNGGFCKDAVCSTCQHQCSLGDLGCDQDGQTACTTDPYGCRVMASWKPCPAGQLCLADICEKATSASCQQDNECKGGYICNNTRCLITCYNHSQCRPGFACVERACQKLPDGICLDDANCPGNFACVLNNKPGLCKTSCQTNLDCRLGYECDNSQCRQVTTTTCSKNEDCKGGFRCNSSNGRCYAACYGASYCQGGYQCDRPRKQCYQLPAGTCFEDYNCVGDFACDAQKMCKTSCSDNLGCRLGYECEKSQCRQVTTTTCKQHADCKGGFRCNFSNGRCYTACYGASYCQGGFQCDRPRKQCYQLPAGTCFEDYNCVGDFACDAQKKCKISCQGNLDCRLGYECDKDQCRQVTTTTCSKNEDCKGGFRCNLSNGRCYAACYGASYCQGGYQCDRPRKQCYQLPAGTCFEDFNCIGDFACDAQKKCKLSCKGNLDCRLGFECINAACVAITTQACMVDGACKGGFKCNTSNNRCHTACYGDSYCQNGYTCDRIRRQCYQ